MCCDRRRWSGRNVVTGIDCSLFGINNRFKSRHIGVVVTRHGVRMLTELVGIMSTREK